MIVRAEEPQQEVVIKIDTNVTLQPSEKHSFTMDLCVEYEKAAYAAFLFDFFYFLWYN